MKLRLEQLRRLASMPHRTIGLAILRLGLGFAGLMLYAEHLREAGFLWGTNGVLPYSAFAAAGHAPSLFSISHAPAFEAGVYLFGAAVSGAFLLGWRTRLMTPLFWLCMWSLYARNPYLMDGGDNLLELVAFYMIFADCGARLSLDALARRRRAPNAWSAMLHNYAALAIMLQLCLLYFTSGFFKAQGHVWQDGTAIYYILRSAEFNLSALGALFWRNAAVVTTLTWGTVIFELAWPFLIWGRRSRFAMVGGAVLLHAMIGYLMGLAWFSFIMIVVQAMAIDDSQYRRMAAAWRRGMAGLRARRSQVSDLVGA